MNRRQWLALLFPALPVAAASMLPECPSDAAGFPCKYNTWVHRARGRQAGVLDVQEVELWVEVREAWRKVEAKVNSWYNL